MIINKIHIEKFRGFNNVEFELGKNITIIAGQNGTQKTTILGLLGQPFTITDDTNPIINEKPLSGGNYKSLFSEKFKLSPNFDTPKNHIWTLYTTDTDTPIFTLESIYRDKISKTIRFWKKGDRTKGSGYLQYPVIYLSLSRLFPIGEDENLNSNSDITLDTVEANLFNKWHNKILIIPNLQINKVDYLSSNQKNTLGVTTNFYDWRTNSAGQDNLGKILLAILSFRRLKNNYQNNYKGGILIIDEIDTTLYPASQIKLLECLRKFSSQYNIQIIFTTHSLPLLEKACELQNDSNLTDQVKVIYLERDDNNIKVENNITFDFIKDRLNVNLSIISPKFNKINTFTEDNECQIFLKGLLKSKKKQLKFINCTMGCDGYIELVRKKIIGFTFPQSLICLDGDVRADTSKMRKIKEYKNFILLPGSLSPERLLADMLFNESDSSEIWNKIQKNYNKQFCFKDYSFEEIMEDRNKAKKWFNSQVNYWGANNNCLRIINIWIDKNKDQYDEFIEIYNNLISKYDI